MLKKIYLFSRLNYRLSVFFFVLSAPMAGISVLLKFINHQFKFYLYEK